DAIAPSVKFQTPRILAPLLNVALHLDFPFLAVRPRSRPIRASCIGFSLKNIGRLHSVMGLPGAACSISLIRLDAWRKPTPSGVGYCAAYGDGHFAAAVSIAGGIGGASFTSGAM